METFFVFLVTFEIGCYPSRSKGLQVFFVNSKKFFWEKCNILDFFDILDF